MGESWTDPRQEHKGEPRVTGEMAQPVDRLLSVCEVPEFDPQHLINETRQNTPALGRWRQEEAQVIFKYRARPGCVGHVSATTEQNKTNKNIKGGLWEWLSG